MKFGVIGYGYWGPNIVRNLVNLEGSQVLAIAEISPQARARAQKAHPDVKVIASAMEVITSPDIDAIAVYRRCGRTTNSPRPPWKTASTCSSRSLSPALRLRAKN